MVKCEILSEPTNRQTVLNTLGRARSIVHATSTIIDIMCPKFLGNIYLQGRRICGLNSKLVCCFSQYFWGFLSRHFKDDQLPMHVQIFLIRPETNIQFYVKLFGVLGESTTKDTLFSIQHDFFFMFQSFISKAFTNMILNFKKVRST